MKLLFIFLQLSFLAQAEPFKMAGQIYDFEEREGLLLYGCKKTCDALKSVKSHRKIDLLKVRKSLTVASSIGSDVCGHVYKEKAILGLNSERDQRTFCLFKDRSMVELNSLETYLLKKGFIQEKPTKNGK